MNRRAFSLQLAGIAGAAALAGGAGLPRVALAQGGPAEGKEYLKVKQPIAMQSTGKIEVVEFFWYGCPHCYHFEPVLEPWVAKLPADVHFRRIPVGFNDVRKEFHQRLYFTLEAMNQVTPCTPRPSRASTRSTSRSTARPTRCSSRRRTASIR